MGDHQHGFSVFLHQANDQIRHDFVGALAVEIARRFVAEQKRRIGNDGAGDGDSLFLPSGELSRIMVHPVGETDDAERGFNVAAAFGFRELGEQERQLDVLKCGHARG